jgi:hypothetical protein
MTGGVGPGGEQMMDVMTAGGVDDDDDDDGELGTSADDTGWSPGDEGEAARSQTSAHVPALSSSNSSGSGAAAAQSSRRRTAGVMMLERKIAESEFLAEARERRNMQPTAVPAAMLGSGGGGGRSGGLQLPPPPPPVMVSPDEASSSSSALHLSLSRLTVASGWDGSVSEEESSVSEEESALFQQPEPEPELDLEAGLAHVSSLSSVLLSSPGGVSGDGDTAAHRRHLERDASGLWRPSSDDHTGLSVERGDCQLSGAITDDHTGLWRASSAASPQACMDMLHRSPSAAAGGAEPDLGPTQEISPSPRSSVVDSSDSDSVRRPETPQLSLMSSPSSAAVAAITDDHTGQVHAELERAQAALAAGELDEAEAAAALAEKLDSAATQRDERLGLMWNNSASATVLLSPGRPRNASHQQRLCELDEILGRTRSGTWLEDSVVERSCCGVFSRSGRCRQACEAAITHRWFERTVRDITACSGFARTHPQSLEIDAHLTRGGWMCRFCY